MLRTTTGKAVSWDSHPSEDRSEPPQRKGTEVSLYPTSPSWRSAAPHGCLVSLLIARSGWRSWRQKTSRFEKRGKIRSTDYSVVKEPRSGDYASSKYNGHFSSVFGGLLKKYFCFFLNISLGFKNSRDINSTSLAVICHPHAAKQTVEIYFKLAFAQK